MAIALYFATILSFNTRFRNLWKGILFFPYLINGAAEQMRALLWPILDNKFLKHPGLGFKLLLPIELWRFVEREEREFYQRSRLDKQNMIPSLECRPSIPDGHAFPAPRQADRAGTGPSETHAAWCSRGDRSLPRAGCALRRLSGFPTVHGPGSP